MTGDWCYLMIVYLYSLPVDWFYLCLVSFPDNPTPEEEAVGEVSIQVDLFTHPGTGEHKITVKGKPLPCFLR